MNGGAWAIPFVPYVYGDVRHRDRGCSGARDY